MNKAKKLLTVALAMGLCLSAMPLARGEANEAAPAPKAQELSAEVKEAETAPAEKNKPESEPKGEKQTPVGTEAPAEDAAAKEAPEASAQAQTTPAPQPEEAPEASEAPVEEDAANNKEETPSDPEATPEPEEIVEIEESETPKGVFPSSAPVAFRGSVSLARKGSGALYIGDVAVLEAKIHNANTAYQIRWEVDRRDGKGWQTIPNERGEEYEFIISEENVAYQYRVVLVTAA